MFWMRLPENMRSYLMVGPALLVIAVLFAGAVLMALRQSLGYMSVLGEEAFTFSHYGNLFLGRDFWLSLGLTLYISITSTVLATVLSVATAMILRQTGPGTRLTTFLYQLPLPVPHLVAAAGIVALISQSGLMARIAYAAGLIGQPGDFPALVFDRANVGTIVVYTWKEVPFMGLVALAVLKSVGHDYEEAAQTLGASTWQRFRYVLLPLMVPGIVATSVIVFAFLFGSFEIPLLLGQRYPNTLPVMAYRLYSDPDLSSRPEAMATGIVITAIMILLLFLYRRAARRLGPETGSPYS